MSPLTNTDAIIKFDVPVTVTLGNLYLLPIKPFFIKILT